jgi:hypothetical protein
MLEIKMIRMPKTRNAVLVTGPVPPMEGTGYRIEVPGKTGAYG